MRFSIPKFNCDIILSTKDLESLKDYLGKTQGAYTNCILFTTQPLAQQYADLVKHILFEQGLTTLLITLPEGEQAKTLSIAENCWLEMNKFGVDRKSLAIGLGGGSVTDLAGFVSSCYMRGIDTYYLPTTLLGMVDASIGGKNGINLASTKNLIGSIHHPKLVLVAPFFLKSLPDRELSSGIAEVIKAGVIWDPDLFDILEHQMSGILGRDQKKLETIIARSCKIKAEIVKIDEKEKNLRTILNYGHTFAHAIETLTNFSQYTHGEAVSIGMHCAAAVSRELNLVDDAFIKKQSQLCLAAKLPVMLPDKLDFDQVIEIMRHDKKAVGHKINLILPRKIGKVDHINDVEPQVIKKALQRCLP